MVSATVAAQRERRQRQLRPAVLTPNSVTSTVTAAAALLRPAGGRCALEPPGQRHPGLRGQGEAESGAAGEPGERALLAPHPGNENQ